MSLTLFEVEVKIKVKDKKKLIDDLLKLGAIHEIDLIHNDIYYNMPQKLRDFAKTDEALRIRKSLEFKEIDGIREILKETSDITYKGPKLDSETKSRVEYLCKIADFEVMDKILVTLGFQKIIQLDKNRKFFSLNYKNKEIGVVFDTIQHLKGFYAEFEVMVSNFSDIEESKTIIFDLMSMLGYEKKDSITDSYLELVIKSLSK